MDEDDEDEEEDNDDDAEAVEEDEGKYEEKDLGSITIHNITFCKTIFLLWICLDSESDLISHNIIFSHLFVFHKTTPLLTPLTCIFLKFY